MEHPIKVMVVDDSALYRKAISDVLSENQQIKVVATAPNGRIALMKLPQCTPDLITLDMEMPEMDGMTTLKKLQKEHPSIKAIVFSHHTERGAELTLKALSSGAVDFVTKPSSGGSLENSLKQIREKLLPTVVELANAHSGSDSYLKTPGTRSIQAIAKSIASVAPRDVIAIGISTGGPISLSQLFAQIPKGLKQSILIVQHMPPIFTKKLAEQLTRAGSIPVKEAIHGDPVEPGHAYVAPGNYHMEVVKKNGRVCIETNQKPQENFCRPAVDVLFRSVADVYKNRAVGVVMTGMGKDGLNGAEFMKMRGAPIVAQDEASSVVWGMPKFIVENNLADVVAPLDKMFDAIRNFILN